MNSGVGFQYSSEREQEREREGERERERERHRERANERERKRDRQTDRGRETEEEGGRRMRREKGVPKDASELLQNVRHIAEIVADTRHVRRASKQHSAVKLPALVTIRLLDTLSHRKVRRLPRLEHLTGLGTHLNTRPWPGLREVVQH